jgi:hypothetical protein
MGEVAARTAAFFSFADANLQVFTVSTLRAKNACASPEVFVRLYGSHAVSPTVKLSECSEVSSVLFLPGGGAGVLCVVL